MRRVPASLLSGAMAATLLFAAPGSANDSSAELGAGGLVLTRNAAIQMRSEDLYISADLVRVKYVFVNRANRDITIHVAFPMPDVAGSEEPLSIPTEEPENLLAFRTVVNGRPVVAQVHADIADLSGGLCAQVRQGGGLEADDTGLVEVEDHGALRPVKPVAAGIEP